MNGPRVQKIDNDPEDQGGFGPASRPESCNILREGLDWSVSCEPHSSFDCGCQEWAQAVDVSK